MFWCLKQDSIVPMTSMFEEISQVAEMEEMVHEELKVQQPTPHQISQEIGRA